MGDRYYKRTSLFQAKRLYKVFKRFVPSNNKTFCLANVIIPPRVSKTHLMIITSHCQTVEQQNLFINKVAECSLTTAELKNKLVSKS